MQGLVTTDWNNHTVGCTERCRRECTNRLDAESRRRSRPPEDHVTPIDRYNRALAEQRAAKVDGSKELLVQQFGSEGAAHVEWIGQRIRGSGGYQPRRTRASKADRSDVLQLEWDDDGE